MPIFGPSLIVLSSASAYPAKPTLTSPLDSATLIFDDTITLNATTTDTPDRIDWVATPVGGGNEIIIDISASPSGYGSFVVVPGGSTTGVALGVAEKFINNSSENPGTFTSPSARWVAGTMSIPFLA